MRIASLGELEQRPEEVVDVAPAGLRRAAHALDDRVAGRGLLGEPVDVGEELGVVLGPVVEEGGPEPVDGRPPDAEVGVPPLVLVPGVALPHVGDADPAGEADPSSTIEHLAVGPVVDLRRRGTGAAAGTSARRPRPSSMSSSRLAVDRSGRRGRRAGTRTRTPALARAHSARRARRRRRPPSRRR